MKHKPIYILICGFILLTGSNVGAGNLEGYLQNLTRTPQVRKHLKFVSNIRSKFHEGQLGPFLGINPKSDKGLNWAMGSATMEHWNTHVVSAHIGSPEFSRLMNISRGVTDDQLAFQALQIGENVSLVRMTSRLDGRAPRDIIAAGGLFPPQGNPNLSLIQHLRGMHRSKGQNLYTAGRYVSQSSGVLEPHSSLIKYIYARSKNPLLYQYSIEGIKGVHPGIYSLTGTTREVVSNGVSLSQITGVRPLVYFQGAQRYEFLSSGFISLEKAAGLY